MPLSFFLVQKLHRPRCLSLSVRSPRDALLSIYQATCLCKTPCFVFVSIAQNTWTRSDEDEKDGRPGRLKTSQGGSAMTHGDVKKLVKKKKNGHEERGSDQGTLILMAFLRLFPALSSLCLFSLPLPPSFLLDVDGITTPSCSKSSLHDVRVTSMSEPPKRARYAW